MSFQSLISGSECAAPANPLSQVLKHTEADRSIQQVCCLLSEVLCTSEMFIINQDRFAGPSSSRVCMKDKYERFYSSDLSAAIPTAWSILFRCIRPGSSFGTSVFRGKPWRTSLCSFRHPRAFKSANERSMGR